MRAHGIVRAAATAIAVVAGGFTAVLGTTQGTPAVAARCPMISARLGLHWPYSSLPENSAAAIDAAHRAGAPKVEVDVNFSRDGVPVAVHDATIDRVTDHTGAVSAYTAAQLASFRLRVEGSYRNKRLSNEHLLSLWGALVRAKADGMRVSVEIKPDRITAAQAHAVALRFGWLNDWSMIDVRSFDPPVLAVMRRADRRIRTTLTVHRTVLRPPAGNVMESINYHWQGQTIRPATVRTLHAAGLQVDAWTPDTASALGTVPRGVDQVTTNNVVAARAYLKAHGC